MKRMLNNKKWHFIVLVLIVFGTYLSACNKITMWNQSTTENQIITDNQTTTEAPLQTEASHQSFLTVHFLKVGKADAIFIQEASGANMLIDSGDDLDAQYIYSYLVKYGVETIDYLILTHPHNDHIGAVDMVIHNFNVKRVVVASTENLEFYLDAYNAIVEKEVEIITADTNESYTLGNATFKFLGPLDLEENNLNNLSVVTQLTYGASTFLFTGDIEEKAEDLLVETYGAALKSDVLKVPHHGSKTSTKKAFLEAVQPDYAIISAGKNEDKDHPNKKTLNRLEDYKIITYNTNPDGTIIVQTDGTTMSVAPAMTKIPLLEPPIPDENKVLEFFTKVGEDNYSVE